MLITDNAPAVRAVLACIVLRCGFRPLIVASGTEAVKVVQIASTNICCAFLGVTMVPLDGITVTTIVAKLAPYLPVVLMSGYPISLLADRLQYVPTAHFLEKPFTLTQVCALLTEIATTKEDAHRSHAPL